jgi:hypothetical protein
MKANIIIALFVAVGLLLFAAGCTEEAAPAPVTPEKTLTPLTKVTTKITTRPTIARPTTDAVPVTPEKTLTQLTKVTTKVTARPTAVAEDFTISNLEDSVSGSGNFKVMTFSGRIKNNQNREASFILIQAEQYDKDNVKIAYSNTVINDLSPGETATFKILIFDQDAINNADHYSVFVK